MLLGDRGKYFAMVFGIAFSALIMTQQPAIFVGLLSRTYSFIQDISLPDIWVMDPSVQFVEEHKPLRDIDLYKVRGVKGVSWAVPLYKNLMSAKLPDGNTKTIDLTGLDDATLIGAPYKIVEGAFSDFRKNDGVFVDKEASQTRLRVKEKSGTSRPLRLGDVLEINDRRAVVVGFVKATRNFVLQPQVYTTYSRALSYSSPSRRQLTYILVKTEEGKDPQEVCKAITNTTDLLALTAEEFKKANLKYWMDNTGIPVNFGISVLLGFLVGAAVVGQTFFNFVQENLKHYAVLKAMGLRNTYLVRMVVFQALSVGFCGYGIGVGLTTLFGMKFYDSILAFRMPTYLLLFSGGGIFIIITLAALVGIMRVIKVDPSTVFRQ